MPFKIRYFRNPLARTDPQRKRRGQKLFHQGMYNLKTLLKNDRARINPAVNTRKAIHGLSYQYSFRYRKFLQDNFMNQSQKLSQWIGTVKNLQSTLQEIHHYPQLKSLLKSRFAKDLQISGIQKYYRPRRKHLAINARTVLAQLGEGSRHRFIGSYQRFGRKHHGQLTILLTDIRYHHQLVTDHLWFNVTKGFKKLGHLKVNDQIEFRARIKKYSKGYLPKNFAPRYDYGLCYPTQIQKLR